MIFSSKGTGLWLEAGAGNDSFRTEDMVNRNVGVLRGNPIHQLAGVADTHQYGTLEP
mgnify:CR=1 FL=1